MEELIYDVWTLILQQLQISDLCSLRNSSKFLRLLLSRPYFEPVWRRASCDIPFKLWCLEGPIYSNCFTYCRYYRTYPLMGKASYRIIINGELGPSISRELLKHKAFVTFGEAIGFCTKEENQFYAFTVELNREARYLESQDCIVATFDVSSRESFHKMQDIVSSTVKYKVPITIVGNASCNQQRQVAREEVEKYCRSIEEGLTSRLAMPEDKIRVGKTTYFEINVAEGLGIMLPIQHSINRLIAFDKGYSRRENIEICMQEVNELFADLAAIVREQSEEFREPELLPLLATNVEKKRCCKCCIL